MENALTVTDMDNSKDINYFNLSYTQLSNLTGLSSRQISRILNGRVKRISFDSINKLSSAIGITNIELNEFVNKMKEENRANPAPYIGGRKLSSNEVDTIKKYKGKFKAKIIADAYDVSRQTISNIWNSIQ